MRMIYTTPRIENAERMARIFLDAGIAARITNDGGWRGRDHRRFSYFSSTSKRNAWPQVWILHADDLPEARQILRDMDIQPAVRHAEELDQVRFGGSSSVLTRRRRVVTRVRRILLIAIAAAVLVVMLQML